MSKKLSTIIGNIKPPVLSNVIFNNQNYNYCLAEIHGLGKKAKIINLILWDASMQNLMNERLVIAWNSKAKKPMNKEDIRRVKTASKVYANQTL
jgi:hypothetical protein